MSEEMKSLRQIIVEKGAEYEFVEIVANKLVGLVKGEARVVRAILDRTAVVHPFNDDSPNARKLARLDEVMVWPRDIEWRQRPSIFTIGQGLTRFDSTISHRRAERNGN